MDISDDGRTVHSPPRAASPYYYAENLTTGYILSFSGSKESGWANYYEWQPNPSYFITPTTPSPTWPLSSSRIRCHRNVVVTYSDITSPTSFFTYDI